MPLTQAIELRDVSFMTPQGRALLDKVSLSIEAGTSTALLGRSGSGKTTLLRMINRLIEPTLGRVVVNGKATVDWDPIALRRSIGYVIQETGLFPHFSAERNVGIVPELEGRSREEIRDRTRQLFALVGLDYATFAPRFPYQLSGGQRQRLGLARALAAEPPLLLMDEPFGALDPLTRAEMQDMVRSLLTKLKKTVVLVTHDLNEALYLASRIVMIDGGKVVADLLSEDFLDSKIPEVERYINAVQRGAGETGRKKP